MTTRGAAEHRLGEPSGSLRVDGLPRIRQLSVQLTGQANRELLIRTQRLNPDIYDRADFVEAVKRLAIRNSRSRIRVLLTDMQPIQRNGHRLLQLAQRLPSSIEFRLGASDWRQDDRSFLLVDQCAYLLRPRWFDLHDAVADFDNRNETRKLAAFFMEIWEQSETPAALRRLSL